jgi:hypothetical protein
MLDESEDSRDQGDWMDGFEFLGKDKEIFCII